MKKEPFNYFSVPKKEESRNFNFLGFGLAALLSNIPFSQREKTIASTQSDVGSVTSVAALSHKPGMFFKCMDSMYGASKLL